MPSTQTATVKRQGRGDNTSYFQAVCAACGWAGSAWPSRTVEGRMLADRDVERHRCKSGAEIITGGARA